MPKKTCLFFASVFSILAFFQCSTTRNKTDIEPSVWPPFDTTYQDVAVENFSVIPSTILTLDDAVFPLEMPTAISITTDGQDYYVLAEGDKESNPNVDNCYLYRLAADGRIKWSNTYDDEHLNQFAADLDYVDEKIYLTAKTFVTSRMDNDFYVAAVDRNGKKLWSHTIATPAPQPVLETLVEEDYLFSVGRNGHPSSVKFSVQLCKFSKDGTYSACNDLKTAPGGLAYSLARLNDSILVVATIDYNHKDKWLRLIGFDDSLEVVWTKRIIKVTGDLPEAQVITDENGNIYVQSQVAVDGFGAQLLLTKIDGGGRVLWNKAYGLAHSFGGSMLRIDKRMFLEIAPDGAVLMGGNTGSLIGTGINYVLATDAGGYPQWATTFPNPNGYFTDLAIVANGLGYVITGYHRRTLTFEEKSRGFILPITKTGASSKE